MMTGCEEASRQGMIVNNVKELVMKNVEVIGCEGEPVVADNVDTFIKE
jgi:hypothetical protein